MNPDTHDGGRGIRDQIDRYRNAFASIVLMIVIAVFVGGFILAHERLTLPGWVPLVGQNVVTLKAEFQTAQAVTPGQGQSVTIAGAKIGEVSSVNLQNGVAMVTMHLDPKYAYVYRNATLLLRPKTQLKDMTVEVNPGTPSAGRVPDGGVIPVSQTAPDVNFDEFLSALDADTRAYLQELLAGLGQGLKNNGKPLSAAFKRFDPIARDLTKISSKLKDRNRNVSHAIHNFQLLISALGSKDKQLAQLVDSSNAVFATFAKQDQDVQNTLRLLPGALSKTKAGLGKLATAAKVLGPTLARLHPTAKALGPALEQARPFLHTTTPIIANRIRPFARQILPVLDRLQPSTQNLAAASPDLATSFSVINEFFNELAYNPGANQAGFLFFLDWANHNLNSVFSSADANGALGHTLIYFNCNLLTILNGAAQVNPTVRLIIGLLNLPSGTACAAPAAAASGTASAASTHAESVALANRIAAHVFGQGPDALVAPSSTIGSGG
ncbi:MAG TPA: MlaD family protein [Solirubrobacteraceae bacterium]|nr:MlaD family protein [Solirubrobacteraceae bacterium]